MENILFITISAIISGCDTWDEIEDFGHNKKEWLLKYIDMPNGIPSHDTLNRFFSSMDPTAFEECFRKWVRSLSLDMTDDVVAIDGKRVVGASKHRKSPIHIVSAWSNKYSITLGQIRTSEKSNEITAIPELLDALMIEGAVVTVDALNSQVNIAEKILEKNADYIMPIKKNRKTMFHDIEFVFEKYGFDVTSKFESEEDHHGRIENRSISVISDLYGIRGIDKWPGIKSIVRLNSSFVEKTTGVVQESTMYYVSSIALTAESAAGYIRSHWGIENNLHWMLDVAFDEDAGRKRNQNSVTNFSMMSKIVLSTFRKDESIKLGVKSKRKKAALNDEYRELILSILLE